jgi:ribosomal protein S18 acetylase RimI-like enzyme
LAKNSKAVSLAFNSGELVGFCVIQDQNGPIWIDWYGVHADVRRCGVGEAILSRLIAENANGSSTKLWCGTRTTNDPSMNLLEKMEFRRLCTLKKHWYGEDFYLWERML